MPNKKVKRNYIIISSFQNIPYALILVKKLDNKNIFLITFDKEVKNFLSRNLKLKSNIFLFNLKMPIVYLNFFKKDFINGIKNIINFYKQVKQVKKKLIFSEISDIYIFGTAVSFANMVAVTHLKFNKIFNIDYMKMNKTLAQSKHAKEGYLLTNFSFRKLRFYIFFLYSTLLSFLNIHTGLMENTFSIIKKKKLKI